MVLEAPPHPPQSDNARWETTGNLRLRPPGGSDRGTEKGKRMSWFRWVIIGWFALNAVCCVWEIGRERKPVEVSDTVTALFLYGVLIAGAILDWGGGK